MSRIKLCLLSGTALDYGIKCGFRLTHAQIRRKTEVNKKDGSYRLYLATTSRERLPAFRNKEFLTERFYTVAVLIKESEPPDESHFIFEHSRIQKLNILEISQRNQLIQILTSNKPSPTEPKTPHRLSKSSFDIKKLTKKRELHIINSEAKNQDKFSSRSQPQFNEKITIKILTNFARTLRTPSDPLYWSNFWDVLESGLIDRITTVQFRMIFESCLKRKPSDNESFNFYYFIKVIEVTGYPLGLIDYNKVLGYMLYRENNLVSILAIPHIWNKISEHQYIPDQETYSAIISKYLELRLWTEALFFMQLMTIKGYLPTEKMVRTLLHIPLFVFSDAIHEIPPPLRKLLLSLFLWRHEIKKYTL